MAETLSIPEVAEELQMTSAGVYKLVQRGKLPVERLSARKTRVKREVLDAYIARHNETVDKLAAQGAPDQARLREAFTVRWDMTPEAWIAAFRRGEIEDTSANMDALVQAAALRTAPDERDARVTRPEEYPWAVAAFAGTPRRGR